MTSKPASSISTALETLLAAHDKASGPADGGDHARQQRDGHRPARATKRQRSCRRMAASSSSMPCRRPVALPLDINEIGADFLIVSSHKIGGPKGAGALDLARRGADAAAADPWRRAGEGSPLRHREFAGASSASARRLKLRSPNSRRAMRRSARCAIGWKPACAWLRPMSSFMARAARALPNTSFFTLPGLKSETGQIAFDLEGVALSAGSACSSGKVGESHVLVAMGRDPKHGRAAHFARLFDDGRRYRQGDCRLCENCRPAQDRRARRPDRSQICGNANFRLPIGLKIPFWPPT